MPTKPADRARANFLGLLTTVTHFVLRPHCKPPACILRARALSLAGDAFGLTLAPVPVRLIAGNAAVGDFFRAEGRLPEQSEEWERLLAAGGWTVGVGFGEDSAKGWGGHLVCCCGDVLCDPSAPDATRERHALEIPPLAVGGWGMGPGADGPRAFFLPSGCFVVYEPAPDCSERWQSAPDWRRVRDYRKPVAQIVRLVRESAAAGECGGA